MNKRLFQIFLSLTLLCVFGCSSEPDREVEDAVAKIEYDTIVTVFARPGDQLGEVVVSFGDKSLILNNENESIAFEGREFFPTPEAITESPRVKVLVSRQNSIPPPRVYNIFFEAGARMASLGSLDVQELVYDLKARNPSEPLRMVLAGQTDCSGSRSRNQILSEDRVRFVFDEIVKPVLLSNGFSENELSDNRRFKLTGLGESFAQSATQAGCTPRYIDNRVGIVVQ